MIRFYVQRVQFSIFRASYTEGGKKNGVTFAAGFNRLFTPLLAFLKIKT